MPEGYLPIQQRTQERIVARTHFRVERHPTVQHPVPHGQDTRPGHCPRQQLIGQPPSMIDQAREVFCQGRFPASLIYALIVSPSPALPSTLCRLPLVILQQAAQSFSTPHLDCKYDCSVSEGEDFKGKPFVTDLVESTILNPRNIRRDTWHARLGVADEVQDFPVGDPYANARRR